jgi:beta-lactam-binding protein with PASTA domain
MAAAGFYVFNRAVQGGESVEVPSITGLPLAKASNVLAEAGLVTGEQAHVVNDRYPPYTVLLQRPESGRVVREGRKVDLTVSAAQQYESTPRLVGNTLEAALTQIGGTRFVAGSIARIPDDAARDTVLGQDPLPGANLAPGDEVHLLVSEGPKVSSLFMPNLVGKSLNETRNILSAMNVRAVPFKTDRPGAAYDVVLSQNPDPGTVLREGQSVTYEVRLAGETILPNARRRVEIVYEVPRVASNPQIRVDVIGDDGNRATVYPQSAHYIDGAPPRLLAGTRMTIPVTYQRQATIEFYADSKLHKSYEYVGDSEPVITNYDIVLDNAYPTGGRDLPPPPRTVSPTDSPRDDRDRRESEELPRRWPWRR